jgi:hypothetical protein
MMRLAHGWRLEFLSEGSRELVAPFVRPALRAVPRAAALRLGRCVVSLPKTLPEQAASRWMMTEDSLRIEVAVENAEPHDAALELLRCIGQALWAVTAAAERTGWLRLLQREIDAGVSGEIDEEALAGKRKLFATHAAAGSAPLLAAYAAESFAGTFAEYAHAMWHDVTVRTGPEHLPAEDLRRRLELMARWFPPNPGYRVFPRRQGRRELF